jgi:hypothetical protein
LKARALTALSRQHPAAAFPPFLMEKKFPQSALVTIRRQAIIYNCACPAQVCETIAHLRELHDYQAKCLNESVMDQSVHHRISTAVEQAHREMEQCLTDILAIEGWDPVTLEMPANLQKRIAEQARTPPAP